VELFLQSSTNAFFDVQIENNNILVLVTGAPQASNLFLALLLPPHVTGYHCFLMCKINLCLQQDQQFQRLEALTVFVDYIGLEYGAVQFGT
jgi:hypothetical protein